MPFSVATEGVSFAAAQISIRNDRGGAQISNSDVVLGLNAAAVAFGLLGSWKSGCYAIHTGALRALHYARGARSAGAAVAYAYLSVLVGVVLLQESDGGSGRAGAARAGRSIARLSDEDIAEMQDWLEEQGLGVRSLLSKLSAEDYDEFESEREWRNKLSEMGEAEYVSFEASWMKLNMEVARRIRSSDGEEKHADFNAKAAEEASKLTDLRAKLRGETESNR